MVDKLIDIIDNMDDDTIAIWTFAIPFTLGTIFGITIGRGL